MTKSTRISTRNLLATAYYTLKTVNDGLDAKYVIINGEQVFKYSNNFSGTPTPATITLTATKFNITANGKWQYKNASAVWTDFSPAQTSTTLSLSPTSGILSTAKSMQVRYIVDTIYDEITIVKVSDGANGTSATAYWLISSASAIGKNTSNAFNPASITFSSKSQTGNGSVANYSGRFIIAETTDGTNFTDKYTSTGNESSKTYTPSSTNVKAIRVRMYQAGGTSVLLDEQLIPVVTDGKNGATGAAAVTAVLSNDSHNIPCNTSGTPSTYAGAVTTMSVFVGATDTSTSWTYTATPTNVKGTLSNNNRTYTVTEITADTGYVDITATRSGYSSVTKRFTLAKSKQGNTGAAGKDAYTVILSNESHTFPGSTSAALAGSTTCGIIAYKGATKVNASIGTVSGVPTGMTVTPVNNNTQNASLTIAVTTSMTTKNGTLTIPITVDGKVFNKDFSYALALKGSTGATGPQGPTGPIGPQGPQGEAKDYYDGSFMDGKKYWSTNYSDTYAAPGNNVVVFKESTSKIGGNVLQIQNDTWLYAKNKICIEQNKIYKFTFRVRQIQDPLNGADKNKVYAGATTFNAAGNKISQNNGSYFIASSQGVTVANGWREYTAYMSTSAKSALVGTDGKTLCPAVRAFDSGTVAIKPMFIVNYSGGNGITQVDALTVEDYTQEWNALNIAKDKLNNNSQQVFDALTDNGRKQGIYMENDQLYVNGQYINAKNLRVVDKNNNLTLGVDENGNVTIRATSLNIGSKPVASKDDVNTSINNIQVGATNLLLNTREEKTITGNNTTNQCTNLYDFADVSILPGKKITTSFTYTVTGYTSGKFRIQTASNVWLGITNDITPTGNGTFTVKHTYTLNSSTGYTYTQIRMDNFVGTVTISKMKIEFGDKATDWSPSPEDIEEGKIDVGGAIDDINNSNGQIQYPKLNVSGMIRFTDFDADLAKHYSVKKDAEGNVVETLINGGTIATGSVAADKMTMYNLSVIRRKKVNGVWQDVDTSFNISDEGHVKASGTFSSFNFNELTRDKGWQINEDGDSVFNNTIVRGRVELPSAGLTDYGSNSRENMLRNTTYKDGTSHHTWGTGTSLDKSFKYNNAHYTAKYDRTGVTSDSWQAVNPTTVACGAGEVVSASVMVYLPTYTTGTTANLLDGTNNNTAYLELQYFKADGTRISTTGQQINYNLKDQWQIVKLENKTTPAETTKINARVYLRRNGKMWITQLKLEKGSTVTDWVPNEADNLSLTRFWAGESYENRDSAPFRVLQNGTIIATRGEFGGTFTGRIEIGNIKIYDTNDSAGVIEIKNKDDVATIVKIGEEQSYFNSPIYIGTPNNTTGQYANSFKISPADKKLEMYSGSSIVVGDKNSTKLSLMNTNNSGWIKFGTDVRMEGQENRLNLLSENGGKIAISIGNFADSSSHDDASLTVDGSAEVKSIKISQLKIYENPDGNGVDFFIE